MATALWRDLLMILALRAPRSLQGRLLATYLSLMTLSIGGLMLWTGVRLQNAVFDQAEHDLELQAFVIANALREPLDHQQEGEDKHEGRGLGELTAAYGETTGARVTVVDTRLRLVASSDTHITSEMLAWSPEFMAARMGQEQYHIRWDAASGEERLFVAAPIIGEDRKATGYTQLSIPMAPLYSAMQQTWWPPLAMGGGVLLVTFLVSVWLARQLARPIEDLTTVSEAMAAGDLRQQVTPAGPNEIERLGRAFNRMAERVQDMLARQQAFVAHAAHELRSPLTGLRLRLELLEQHGVAQPDLTPRYLAQMQREINHLQRLVDHLLALAALEEDQSPPRSLVDLAPLLYELADEVSPLIQQAQLHLTVDVPPHLSPVLVNPDQMRIVLHNLLDNAIKYTASGGRITLSAHAADQQLVISVEDTGVGIPPDALPQIFERFYRVDEARSRRQGAGLGLSLVQSIVQAHGGQIMVESQVGRGSVFTLSLPLR